MHMASWPSDGVIGPREALKYVPGCQGRRVRVAGSNLSLLHPALRAAPSAFSCLRPNWVLARDHLALPASREQRCAHAPARPRQPSTSLHASPPPLAPAAPREARRPPREPAAADDDADACRRSHAPTRPPAGARAPAAAGAAPEPNARGKPSAPRPSRLCTPPKGALRDGSRRLSKSKAKTGALARLIHRGCAQAARRRARECLERASSGERKKAQIASLCNSTRAQRRAPSPDSARRGSRGGSFRAPRATCSRSAAPHTGDGAQPNLGEVRCAPRQQLRSARVVALRGITAGRGEGARYGTPLAWDEARPRQRGAGGRGAEGTNHFRALAPRLVWARRRAVAAQRAARAARRGHGHA